MGYIYLIQNIQNNKIYIGKTTSKEPIKYVEKHFIVALYNSERVVKKYLYNAIRKYRPQNFKWQILGYCESKEELNEAETICIEYFKSNDKRYGYNMTCGGDGGAIRFGKHSEETKQKMRKPKSKQAKLNMKNAQNKIRQKHKINSTNMWANNDFRNKMKIIGKNIWNNNYERKLKFSKMFSGKNNPSAIQLDTLKILELYNEGLSHTKIAKIFNCSRPTITKRIKNPELYI